MNDTVMNESIIDTITGLSMVVLEPSATTKRVVRTIFITIGILVLVIALADRALAEDYQRGSEDEEQEDKYWDLSGDFEDGEEREQQELEREREEEKQAEERREELEKQEGSEESDGQEYEEENEYKGQEYEEYTDNSTGNYSVQALAALTVEPLVVEPVVPEEPVVALTVPVDPALEAQERAIRERIAALEKEFGSEEQAPATVKSRPAIDPAKQAELDALHERLNALTRQPTPDEAATVTVTETPRQSFWSWFLRVFGLA